MSAFRAKTCWLMHQWGCMRAWHGDLKPFSPSTDKADEYSLFTAAYKSTQPDKIYAEEEKDEEDEEEQK